MKYLTFMLFFLSASLVNADSGAPIATDNLDAIANAIRSGNATALSAHMADKLELVINGDAQLISSQEAKTKVAAFFQQNKPASFDIAHKGTARGNASHYCIGDLKTSNGSFRVYIYLKQEGNAQKIVELRLDK